MVINLVTRLRERAQITLPSDIVKRLNLKTGDNLEIELNGDKIIIKPVLIIDRAQSWFWTKEWQEKEKEVEKDVKAGRIYRARDYTDLVKKLKK